MGIFSDILDTIEEAPGRLKDAGGAVLDLAQIPSDYAKQGLGYVGYGAEYLNQNTGNLLGSNEEEWTLMQQRMKDEGGRGAWEAMQNNNSRPMRALLDIASDPLTYAGSVVKVGSGLSQGARAMRAGGNAGALTKGLSYTGDVAGSALETMGKIGQDPTFISPGLSKLNQATGDQAGRLGEWAKGSSGGRFFTELSTRAKAARWAKEGSDLLQRGYDVIHPNSGQLDAARSMGQLNGADSKWLLPATNTNPAGINPIPALERHSPMPTELKVRDKARTTNSKTVSQVTKEIADGTSDGASFHLVDGVLKTLPPGSVSGPFTHITGMASPGVGGSFDLKKVGTGYGVRGTDVTKINDFISEFGDVAGPVGDKVTFGLYKMGNSPKYTFDIGIQTMDQDEADLVGSLLNQESSYDYVNNAVTMSSAGLKNSDSPIKDPDDLRDFLSALQDARLSDAPMEQTMAEYGYTASGGRITRNAMEVKADGSATIVLGAVPQDLATKRALRAIRGVTQEPDIDPSSGAIKGLVAKLQLPDEDSAKVVQGFMPQVNDMTASIKLAKGMADWRANGMQDDIEMHLQNQGFQLPSLNTPHGRSVVETPGDFTKSPSRIVAYQGGVPVEQGLTSERKNMEIFALSSEENARLQSLTIGDRPALEIITDEMDSFQAAQADNPELDRLWGAKDSQVKRDEKINDYFGGKDTSEAIAARLVSKQWRDKGVDIANDDVHNALSKMINQESKKKFDIKPLAPSKYRIMKTIWSEVALLSPRYLAANFVGNTVDAMIARRFDFGKALSYTNLKSMVNGNTPGHITEAMDLSAAGRIGKANLTGNDKIEDLIDTPVSRIIEEWGYTPGNSVLQQTTRNVIGSEERDSELGHQLQKLFGGRVAKLSKIPEGVQAFGYGLDVVGRAAFFRTSLDEGFERHADELMGKVSDHISKSGLDPAAFDNLPTKDPVKLYQYLKDMGVEDGYAKRASHDLAEVRNTLFKESKAFTDKTFLNYDKTRADEFVAHIVPFHYWASRKLPWYAEQAMSNPRLLVNYARAVEGIQNAQDDPGMDARQKGFLRLLSGPGGFSILMNPDSVMGVIKASGLYDSGYEKTGEPGIGKILSALKKNGVGLFPWIDGAVNMIGGYGDTFEPDMIGIRHRAIVGASVNWINAESGGDPMGSPYAELNDEIRGKVSNWASILLPDWLSVPVAPSAGGSITQQSIVWSIENEIISNNPNLTNGELASIMGDPTRPEYQEAYKSASRAGVIGQFLTFTAPVSVKLRSDKADVRSAQSKIVSDEAQKMGISAEEMSPGMVSPEFLAEYKRKTGEDFQYGKIEDVMTKNEMVRTTPAGRTFTILDAGYQNIGTYNQRRIWKKYQALLNGEESFGGVNSLYETPATRQIMAYNFLNSEPGATRDMQTLRELQSSYRLQNPEFDMFKQWQGQMYDAKTKMGGDLSKYRQLASQRSPQVAQYFSEQTAYLQKQGITGKELLDRLDQITTNSATYQIISQGEQPKDNGPEAAQIPDPVQQISPPQPDYTAYTPGPQTYSDPNQPVAYQGIWSQALNERQTTGR